LRLERELGSLRLGQRRLRPQLVEDVELEIAAEGVSITALSDTPLRAARIFTRLSTSSAIVSVVLTFAI
jgi:hypothetical protein